MTRERLSNRRGLSGGFTLLEVMLALSIFMMAAVGLAVCLNEALEAADAARFDAGVRMHLSNALSESLLGKLSPGSETLESDSKDVAYERSIEALDVKSVGGHSLPSLYRITVIAHWKRHGLPDESSAELYVYQP